MKPCIKFPLPALIAALDLMLAGRVTAQKFTTLRSFSGPDGAVPQAGLITNSSGNTFYGTAYSAGNSGNGTVFRVNTDGRGFTNLHSFTGPMNVGDSTTNSDGANPQAGLILFGTPYERT